MTVSVTGFPTTDGGRLNLTISSTGGSVSLNLSGASTSPPVVLELPTFVANIAGTTSGTVDEAAGTVTLAPGTRAVTIQLRQAPSS